MGSLTQFHLTTCSLSSGLVLCLTTGDLLRNLCRVPAGKFDEVFLDRLEALVTLHFVSCNSALQDKPPDILARIGLVDVGGCDLCLEGQQQASEGYRFRVHMTEEHTDGAHTATGPRRCQQSGRSSDQFSII